ncbi:MAG: chromosome segregation protein SMC [Proteocatella sp.]
MKLKSIELKGFKSFHNKTKIEFPDGIISIVGPNGSGKSNVLDAFRWVLGEQSAKNLRGDKMEDVIFSGTKRHTQANQCEVEIIFDNEDQSLDIPFSEVSIKRKVYRDGDGAYYINGKTCRLKEIRELLLDSGIGKEGYSVISQGKIDEIVNSTSVQRRKLLEEASGISKFRFKKEESEKKLESTKSNMERLNDIYAEIEKQIEPLKKQSEKAYRYLELKNELKKVEINCLLKDYDSSYENHSQDIKDLEKIVSDISDLNGVIREHENMIEAHEADKAALSDKSLQLEQEKNELKLRRNDINNEINKDTEKIENNQKHILKLKQNIFSAEEKMKALNDKLLGIELLKEETNLNLSNLENQKLNLLQEKSELALKFENFNKDNEHLFSEKQKLTEEKHKKIYSLEFLKENIEYENKKKQEVKETLLQMKQSLNEVEFKIEDLKRKTNICTSQINDAQKEKEEIVNLLEAHRKVKIELESKKEKLILEIRDIKTKQNIYISMEKDMDGLNKSVKTILENKNLEGIVDVVANLITTDAKYEKAVETALGASLQHIVTQDSIAAKRAVEFLKRTKSGRATFLPLDTVKGSRLDMSDIKTVSDVVDCDAKYRGIKESLLGRTILVQNMDEAVVLSKKLNYRYRIVTLDGEIFNQGGSITGGHYYKQTNILGRKRVIQEYEQRIESLDNELKLQVDELNQNVQKEKEFADKLNLIDQAIRQAIKNRETLNFELNDFENKYKYIKNSIENLENETNSKVGLQEENIRKTALIENEIKLIENSLSKIDEELGLISRDKIDLESKKENLLKLELELNVEISKHQSKFESYNVEIQGLLTLKENYEAQLQNSRDEKLELSKELSAIEKRLSELNLELQLNQIEMDELNINSDDLRVQIKKVESKCHEISEAKKNKEALKLRKIEEQYKLENKIGKIQVITQNVVRKIEEEYQLTIEDARELYNPNESYEKKDVVVLKAKIEDLGNINLDSIEDYKVLAERYELYSEQISDLDKSIIALEAIITELEKDMTKEFGENFNLINETFGKVFAQLFGGGEGKLILSNPSDILNSEIEIVAQPEGKKLKSISVMSGGEKALMAIALLFSILMTKPAPFCILDEIDAALDDSNIVRFNSFLEKLSKEIQFVTITHRRGTMETSDYIYGVTMQDKGVSKIVSLKFEEATDFIEQ